MNNKAFVLLMGILGVGLLIVSVMYFVEPAKSLPAFFPGYDVTLLKHHYKHAIGAFFLGLGAFAYVWFNSGKKETPPKK